MQKTNATHRPTLNTEESEENLTRMNFEVSETLRNEFKAKVASRGESMKKVFAEFMRQYIDEH